MNIITVVVDALRADHVSCYGYSRTTTPNLENLLKDSVLFENCYASTTWTRPSAATLLTGLYPSVHGVHNLADKLPQTIETFPEYLRSSGFRTAAFAPGGNFSASLGFERGFDRFETFDKLSQNLDEAAKSRRKVIKRLSEQKFGADQIVIPAAEDMVHSYLQWLDEDSASDTFALLWLIDTHAPFNPPPEFRIFSQHQQHEKKLSLFSANTKEDAENLINLYDDMILYVDHCLGKLIEILRLQELYDETLIIITSDHGEAFLEHGVAGHGQPPFEELLRVPLMIKFPEARCAGERVDSLVWLGDLKPTILEMAGISVKNNDQGYSLLLSKGNHMQIGDIEKRRKFLYSETLQSGMTRRWLSVQSRGWKYIQLASSPMPPKQLIFRRIRRLLVRGEFWKIIKSPLSFYKKRFSIPTEMLFNLINDPYEKDNVIAKHPEIASTLREHLSNWQAENQKLAQKLRLEANTMTKDEQRVIQDHLRGLGYLE